MQGMESDTAYEVVNSATLATFKDGSKRILVINQALFDSHPKQMEALLQPHQARAHGCVVDDCSKFHLKDEHTPGTQCIQTPDETVPLYFDGLKTYFAVSKPTEEDLSKYPYVELTSPLPYEPTKRIYTRRRQNKRDIKSLAEWRARLGYPTLEVTQRTLDATTQMVPTVEAETRDYPQDHFKSRLPMLHPHRVNDTLYTDTFFSSIRSIRGYEMWQMSSFLHTKLDVAKLMKRKSQVVGAYEDIIREIGAPNYTITASAAEVTGRRWRDVNRKFCIESRISEAYHQNQNVAERRGGDFKTHLLKLYLHTPWAPLSYWCYGVEYLSLVRGYLARKSLDWRPANEYMTGETLDISAFRFAWFAPIWYYDPRKHFPEGKMKPGFVLGIDPRVGDGFSYIILPVKDLDQIPTRRAPKTLVRSVVRKRDLSLDIEDAPTARETVKGFIKFYDKNGKVLQGAEELEPAWQTLLSDLEEDADDVARYYHDRAQQADKLQATSEQSTTLGEIAGPMESYPADDASAQEEVPADNPSQSLWQEIVEEHVPTTSGVPSRNTPMPPVPTRPPSDNPNVPLVSQTQDDDPIYEYDPNHPVRHDQSDIVSDDEDDDDNSVASITSTISEQADDSADDIHSQFNRAECDHTGDIVAIIDHSDTEGILELQVKYSTREKEWHPFSLVKDEDPQAVARYIDNVDLGDKFLNQRYKRWARKFIRDLKKTMRRMYRVSYEGYQIMCLDDPPVTMNVRRAAMGQGSSRSSAARQQSGKRKKPGKNNRSMGNFKYGIRVPKNWKEARALDKAAGNNKWKEAIEKEVAALIHHKCFEFRSSSYKPSSDYQYAPMKMIYEVKNDLRYKARFIIQGCKVDPRGLSTRATVVKQVSVWLLDLIAHQDNLDIVCGDIGNAFIQAHTNEKCWTHCGPEFGPDRIGMKAIIIRALYGLTTSAERFRTLFADFLRSLGFVPTRYDRDVWMREREEKDGYDYICTHVDDFKIIARKPNYWMSKIKQTFLVKQAGEPDYYLGTNYKYSEADKLWTTGSVQYVKEAIRKAEEVFGCLSKQKTPLPSKDCHPELDTSPLLDEEGHRFYQQLIGMLQWAVCIGRPDICHAVASLNRFGSCPRDNHLVLAKHVFGYLKRVPDKKIAIDSRDLQYDRSDLDHYHKLIPDFLQDYPTAKEELDSGFPTAYGRELSTTIMLDADHAHDRKTRRSLTGLITFVGSTPVAWYSKRQGAVASSTYSAEFAALRAGTEEAINIRYMLRCLGVPVSKPTRLFGDNRGVIQNADNPHADIKKKHVAISFHMVREAIAARIVEPYWVAGRANTADITTKQTPAPTHEGHCQFLFHRDGFPLRENNTLHVTTRRRKRRRYH